MGLSDREYVLKALGGDNEAYGALIDAYQGMVFAVALNITGDYSDSEDIVQDAFLSAYQKLRSLSDPSKFASWLYTLTKRLALKFIKEKRRIPLTEAEEIPSAQVESKAESPAEAYARKELSNILWSQVAELPPKTREAILLYYVEGFSISRAAVFLGISEEAMKMRLKFGREKLRDSLMGKIEGELRQHQPSKKRRNAILAALPAGGTPPLVPSTLNLPLVAASTKTNIAVVAVAVVVIAAGIYTFLGRNAGRVPPGSPSPITGPSLTKEEQKAAEADLKDKAAEAPSQIASRPAPPENQMAGSPGTIQMPTPISDEEAAQARASISGIVYDDAENSVADAGIYHVKNLAGKITSFNDLKATLLTSTNNEGAYLIQKMPPGEYQLAAYKEGYALPLFLEKNPRKISVKAGEELSGIDFRLQRSFSISGKVMDYRHQPLDDASVRIKMVLTPQGYQRVIQWNVLTNATGDYVFEGLPEGQYDLSASFQDYADEVKPDVPAGSEEVNFILAPESGVSGRITIKATGEPAAGVKVTAQGSRYSKGGLHASADVVRKGGSAVTDDDGYYLIKALNADTYPIVVDKYNYEGKTLVTEPRTVELPIGEMVKNVDFFLYEASSISGRVVEKHSSKPISNAMIIMGFDRDSNATTDADGYYHLSGLVPRRYYLNIEAEGYVMKYIAGYDKKGFCCITNIHRQIDLGPEEHLTGIDFEMESEGMITGRVVDPDGQPLANAKIQYILGSPYRCDSRWRLSTDEHGYYRISGINTGDYYVKASLQNYVTARSDLIHIEAGETVQVPNIVLHLKGARIMGSITSSSGEPVRDAVVKAVQVYGAIAMAYFHTVGEARSDANGDYIIPMMGLGPLEIQVSAPGYELATRRLEVDDLSQDYTEDLVLGGTLSITGIIKDSKDNPLANVMILAMPQKEKGVESDGASTGVDGRFNLSRVKPNEVYKLNISRIGYETQDISDVPPGKENIEITLLKCGSIAGKVIDAETGEPIQDFALIVCPEKLEITRDIDVNKMHSEDGTFTMNDLQSGLYHFSLIADGYSDYEQENIQVSPEQVTQLEPIMLEKM